ncbi:CRAL-TRIO domain-containing protein [Powellomyces hirtus]|nr:CRAL-TRIO domain-containing protein [Powellomyces hirtus]
MDAHRAKDMLLGYVEWRRKDGIDELPMPGINGNPVQQTTRGFKSIPDANWDFNAPGMPEEYKKFVKCTPATMLDWHIRNNEMIFNVLMPEVSERTGKLIEKHIVIFDLTNSGMWQFDMTGLHLLKAVSDLDSKMYPERLSRLFIVNTPGIFTRAWNIVKRWLDKRILEKIFILDSNYQDVLLQHIDPENLPEFLGGTCKCSHMPGGCVPSPYLESKKATGGGDNFLHTASLGSTVFEHTMAIAKEDMEGAQVDLHYKFKTSKKGVQFEVRHQNEAGEETVVVPSANYESQKETIQSQIPVLPGKYILSWQKPAGGFAMFNSSTLDFSCDFDLRGDEETKASTVAGQSQSQDDLGAEKLAQLQV